MNKINKSKNNFNFKTLNNKEDSKGIFLENKEELETYITNMLKNSVKRIKIKNYVVSNLRYEPNTKISINLINT